MFLLRLAGVVAVAFSGTSALAATTQEIDLKLRFDGLTYFDASIYQILSVNPVQLSPVLENVALSQADDIWGLPTLFRTGFPDYTVGEELGFSAQLTVADDPSEGLGTLDRCMLGGYDCGGGATAAGVSGGDFDVIYGTSGLSGITDWLQGGTRPGDSVAWDYYPFYIDSYLNTVPANYRYVEYVTDDFGHYARWTVVRAQFTVLTPDPVTPAPVPLPVPAILLPFGLVGIAALRRRGKAARG